MLTIRFSRVGKKNHAQYRIVLAEKSSPVKGNFVELLGSYDPHQKQAVLKEDRIKHWLGNGAQCSDSVYNLLVEKKVIEGEKRKVKMPEKEEIKEEGGEKKEDVVEEKEVEVKTDAKESDLKGEEKEVVEPEEKEGMKEVDTEKEKTEEVNIEEKKKKTEEKEEESVDKK